MDTVAAKEQKEQKDQETLAAMSNIFAELLEGTPERPSILKRFFASDVGEALVDLLRLIILKEDEVADADPKAFRQNTLAAIKNTFGCLAEGAQHGVSLLDEFFKTEEGEALARLIADYTFDKIKVRLQMSESHLLMRVWTEEALEELVTKKPELFTPIFESIVAKWAAEDPGKLTTIIEPIVADLLKTRLAPPLEQVSATDPNVAGFIQAESWKAKSEETPEKKIQSVPDEPPVEIPKEEFPTSPPSNKPSTGKGKKKKK